MGVSEALPRMRRGRPAAASGPSRGPDRRARRSEPSCEPSRESSRKPSVKRRGLRDRLCALGALCLAGVLCAAPAARAAGPAGCTPSGAALVLPGVRLWCTDTGGAGEVLVLLHPNSGTQALWAPQVVVFAAAGYRVIGFDRRGWGRSEPLASEDNGAASIAADLEALAQALGLGRFHLLGLAGGGFAALDYAAWKPERILSLIVGASTGDFSDPLLREMVARIEIPGLRAQPAAYRELGPSYRAADPQGSLAWTQIEAQARRPGARPQRLHSPNTLAKIGAIEAPVLVLAGGADLLAPPALMRRWFQALRHAQWGLIPEAGHAISWEAPALFNQAVLDFLRAHPAAPG